MRFTKLHSKMMLILCIFGMAVTAGFSQQKLEVDGLSIINNNNEALRLLGSTNYLSFYNGSTFKGYLYHDNTNMHLRNSLNGYLQFGTNGTADMTIASSGNIGVGTTNPLTKLHVVGDILRLTDPSSSSRSIEMRTDGAGMDLTALGGFLYLNSTSSEVRINNGNLLRAYSGIRVSGNTDGAGWAFGVNGSSKFRGLTQIESTNSTANALEGKCVFAAGTTVDRHGVYGENIVTPYYGYGLYGRGGYMGVYGISNLSGSNTRFGVYGTAANGTTANYGVYGTAGGSVGTRYAGYFSGNLHYTGTLTGPSDVNLKTDITTTHDVLSKLKELQVKDYMFKSEIVEKMNVSDQPQTGFIAQEIQAIFPNLVSDQVMEDPDEKGIFIEYLGVNQIGMIPLLTKGIQEQQKTIESLQAGMNKVTVEKEALAQKVNSLEQKLNDVINLMSSKN